jgi:hypothetical protein
LKVVGAGEGDYGWGIEGEGAGDRAGLTVGVGGRIRIRSVACISLKDVAIKRTRCDDVLRRCGWRFIDMAFGCMHGFTGVRWLFCG